MFLVAMRFLGIEMIKMVAAFAATMIPDLSIVRRTETMLSHTRDMSVLSFLYLAIPFCALMCRNCVAAMNGVMEEIRWVKVRWRRCTLNGSDIPHWNTGVVRFEFLQQ